MADELATRNAAPMPWNTRTMISHRPAALPCIHVMVSSSEKKVKMAKPRLYIRTRP